VKCAAVPSIPEDQTLHPYFDDVSNEQWLFAEVLEDAPAFFKFFVCPPEDWEEILKARVKKHFKAFELNSLYVSQSGAHLADIRLQLGTLLDKVGLEDVRQHLLKGFESRYANHANSWQTAMYKAMADSNWFCDGGFRE
jgi:hypothetical protein